MTKQIREILIYDGDEYYMNTYPLFEYLNTNSIIFENQSSSCWRGYVGKWEIKDNKLFLIDITGCFENDKKVLLNDLFLGQKEVFANWFTGKLEIECGKIINYEDEISIHFPIYEETLFIEIYFGILTNTYVSNNREYKKNSKIKNTWSIWDGQHLVLRKHLLKHPKEFCFMISKYYNIPHNLIEQYKTLIDWELLSCNIKIYWTTELIEQYDEKWNWSRYSQGLTIEIYNYGWVGLSGNTAIPWTIELIDKFKDKWSWNGVETDQYEWHYGLIGNKSLPWSLDFIERYKTKWIWNERRFSSGYFYPSPTISDNRFIPWTIDFILEHQNKFDWGANFLDCNGDRNYIPGLSGNETLPWSFCLIDKFINLWEWSWLSSNKAIPWSDELISKYITKWNWARLSSNDALPWSNNLIDKYDNYWNWENLSDNPSLPWSFEFIEKYYDKWDWHILSGNEGITWSHKLIEQYENKLDINRLIFCKIDWSYNLFLKFESKLTINWTLTTHNNNNVPWLFIIETKLDKIGQDDWYGLSRNESLPWDVNLINKYCDKWNWKYLSGNQGIPWTIPLINTYNNRWNWEALLSNNSVYEKAIAPYLTDILVEDILRKISNNS